MENILYPKGKAIDYIYQYSKYHGNLLIFCEGLMDEESSNSLPALIFLLNITENVMRNVIGDFDNKTKLYEVIKELESRNYITNREGKFLNQGKNSIRSLRNIFTHAQLSKYNLEVNEEGKKVLYPFTENTTCAYIYNQISDILFNIMMKIVSQSFIENMKITLDTSTAISKVNIKIVEITPEQLLKFKGFDDDYFNSDEWKLLDEDSRYRLAEDASDINVLTSIFSRLLK